MSESETLAIKLATDYLNDGQALRRFSGTGNSWQLAGTVLSVSVSVSVSELESESEIASVGSKAVGSRQELKYLNLSLSLSLNF